MQVFIYRYINILKYMKSKLIYRTTKITLWFLVIISLIGAILIPIFLGFWGIAQAHQPISFKESLGYNEKLDNIQSYKMPIQGSLFNRRPWLCCYLPDGIMLVLSIFGLLIVNKNENKNRVFALNTGN